MICDGEALEDRASSLRVHLAQRIFEGQWHPGTSADQYLADLRSAVIQDDTRIAVYERQGGAIAAALATNTIPADRLGEQRQQYLFIVYSAERGTIITGYQTEGMSELSIPETVRWLT